MFEPISKNTNIIVDSPEQLFAKYFYMFLYKYLVMFKKFQIMAYIFYDCLMI